MPWVELDPPAQAALPRSIAMVGRTKRGNSSQGAALRISVRPELVGLEWLRWGARVSVSLGDGAFAGKLRISQGGRIRVTRGAGPRGSRLMVVSVLAPLDGPTLGARDVDAVVLDGALIVSLPGWACPAAGADHRATSLAAGA